MKPVSEFMVTVWRSSYTGTFDVGAEGGGNCEAWALPHVLFY